MCLSVWVVRALLNAISKAQWKKRASREREIRGSFPVVPVEPYQGPEHWCFGSYPADRLVGLVVMASASRAEDPGFESRLRRDFSGSSHTSDLKIGTPGTTLQGSGGIGSALGLVCPMLVYCDWVR